MTTREQRIYKWFEALSNLVDEAGANENTKIYPNATVINSAPTDLPSDYVIVEDEQGFYMPALKVPGVVYNNGDLVNLLYIKGTEPIAFQHGTGSGSSAIFDAADIAYNTEAYWYWDNYWYTIPDDVEEALDALITIGGGGGGSSSGGWPFVVKNQQTGINYATLTAAIAASAASDTLLVGDDITEDVAVNKAVIIKGMAQEITVSGTLTVSANATIENLTVLDNVSCIALSGTPTVTFRDVIVDGVAAGTGFTLSSGSTVYLWNCITRNCGNALDSTNATSVLYFGRYGEFKLSDAGNSVTTFWTLKGGGVNLFNFATQPVGWVIYETNNRLTNWSGNSGRFQLGTNTYVNDIVTTLDNPGDDTTLVTEAAIRTALNSAGGWPNAQKLMINNTEYASYAAAIAGGAAADIVKIGQGTITEAVTLSKAMQFIGLGPEKTILTNSTNAHTMTITGTPAAVEGLSINNTGTGSSRACLTPAAANSTTRNCILTRTGAALNSYGYYFAYAGQKLIDTEISVSGGTNNYGVRNDTAIGDIIIERCIITSTNWALYSDQDGSTFELQDSYLTGNIEVTGNSTTLDIYGGTVVGNIIVTAGSPTINLHGLPTITGTIDSNVVGWYIDSNGDIRNAAGWISWTPTCTQSGSVGVTVTKGQYQIINDICFVEIFLTVTGSGTGGNAISIGGQPAAIQLAAGTRIAAGSVVDTGTISYYGIVYVAGATDWRFIDFTTKNYIGIDPNFSLAAGDIIQFKIFYGL